MRLLCTEVVKEYCLLLLEKMSETKNEMVMYYANDVDR